jgi:hypothetical protein
MYLFIWLVWKSFGEPAFNIRLVLLITIAAILLLGSTDTHFDITNPKAIWLYLWAPMAIMFGHLQHSIDNRRIEGAS